LFLAHGAGPALLLLLLLSGCHQRHVLLLLLLLLLAAGHVLLWVPLLHAAAWLQAPPLGAC
jgi:hypothetical protein